MMAKLCSTEEKFHWLNLFIDVTTLKTKNSCYQRMVNEFLTIGLSFINKH